MANDNQEGRELQAVIPHFEWPTFGYRHTIDSAFVSLLALGIDPDRVTFRKAGRGWTAGRIVSHERGAGRAAGTPDDIVLNVAGDGLFDRLPTALRDRGTAAEPGLDTLLLAFDDPAEKASWYARQGGLYFDLRPGNPTGCARWIRLFGIQPEQWPTDSWYTLARFLPLLHRVSGQETGLRLGLKLLADLDIARFEWAWQRTALSTDGLTRMGEAATRLGVDFVVGQTLEDESVLKIVFGPMRVADYRRYQTKEMQRRIGLIFDLVFPCHLIRHVDWLVGNPDFKPRLATDEDNAVLGINMHLGRKVGKSAG
jgi:hypothetical protein